MTNKIAITGGKGGTGKSTVATSLAVEMKKYGRVLLVDADVDCPNDNLILSVKMNKIRDVNTMIPEIDKEKCIKCGKCSEVCMENALVFVKEKYPILVQDQCTGCRACKIACPVNAIKESKQKIGEIYGGKGEVDVINGVLRPGIEESSLVVNSLKEHMEEIENNYDYIIIDTAAGTHCPVISAISGVKKAIAVTEPTPLGAHDLELILKIMKALEIKSNIIINRADISENNEINILSKKYDSKIISRIPYSKEIIKNYSEGKPIQHDEIKKIAEMLK